MKVPSSYAKYAQAVIDSFWTRMIEKQGYPVLSKAQIRAIITSSISTMQAADGDPATWTACGHCDGDGWYRTSPTDQELAQANILDKEDGGMIVRGLCYQCKGKGRQSEADRRRNWGYVRGKAEAWEA